MRPLTALTLFSALLLGPTACDSGSYDQAGRAEAAPESASAPDKAEQPATLALEDRKIIRRAEIRFQVEDLEASTQRLREMAEEFNGFVASMNQHNSNYERANQLTIRVPSDQFDAFLTRAESLSAFTNYKRISAEDVTEEYVDITTRLKTKKEVRDRYIDLLRNQAKTVEDILAAEERIRVIQEEIEAIEGRLQYLNNRISLSTVEIEMYQEVEYRRGPEVYREPFGAKVKEGFLNGWDAFKSVLVGLISLWPFLILLTLLIVFRKRLRFWRRS